MTESRQDDQKKYYQLITINMGLKDQLTAKILSKQTDHRQCRSLGTSFGLGKHGVMDLKRWTLVLESTTCNRDPEAPRRLFHWGF